jgi:hypothetical protein
VKRQEVFVVAPRRKQAPACGAHNKPHLCNLLCSKLFARDGKAKVSSVLLAFLFQCESPVAKPFFCPFDSARRKPFSFMVERGGGSNN